MESAPSAKGEAEQAGSPKDADMRTAELEARAHMLTGKLKETVVRPLDASLHSFAVCPCPAP